MNKPLLAIAMLAFALRLGYAAASGALRHPQVWEQEGIATSLIERHAFVYEHRSFAYRSYTEPLYPFLAALVYLATNHSHTALVLVQLIIAAATVWMTGRAARLASGDDRVANIAALLVAIHPGFIRYSSVLHPFVLDSFFFVAGAAAILRYRQEPVLRRGIAAALIIGAGALTRPTILLFLIPLIVIARRAREMIIVTLVALAVVAPWTIRNAVVQHTFMLTRSGTGLVFWLGNNPASSGSATDVEGRAIVDQAPPEMRQRIAVADEVTRDRIYSEAAWSYIRADPLAAIGRAIQRFGYFWWFSPQWGAAFSPIAKIVYRAWWALLLALIMIGLFVSRRLPQRRDLWLMAALALLISLAQSAYYVEGRHRLAIEPLLMPLAAVAILRASSRINRRPL